MTNTTVKHPHPQVRNITTKTSNKYLENFFAILLILSISSTILNYSGSMKCSISHKVLDLYYYHYNLLLFLKVNVGQRIEKRHMFTETQVEIKTISLPWETEP